MKKIHLFIDIEFTDFENPDLISLALYANDEQSFYIENKDARFKQTSNPQFIQNVVKPLLNLEEFGVERSKIALKVNQFLNQLAQDYDEIVLMADQLIDLRIFFEWIDFDSYDFKLEVFTEKFLLLEKNNFLPKNTLIDHFFKEQKTIFEYLGLQKHHALNDAKTNCMAYYHTIEKFNLIENTKINKAKI